MAGGGDTDPATHALGVVAGVLLAICLMPQLWKMYRSKSAQDISYGWTAFYFLGLIFYFAYLFRLDAVVGWIGILVEIVLVVFVVLGKFYLEHYYQPKHGTKGRAEVVASDAEVNDGIASRSGSKQARSSEPVALVGPGPLPVPKHACADETKDTSGQVVLDLGPMGTLAAADSSRRSTADLLSNVAATG